MSVPVNLTALKAFTFEPHNITNTDVLQIVEEYDMTLSDRMDQLKQRVDEAATAAAAAVAASGGKRKLAPSAQPIAAVRAVKAVIMVHEHQHPHILMLQSGNGFYELPGGPLKPDESEAQGLKRLLSGFFGASVNAWSVGECVAVWHRPNFENYLFPYPVPHIKQHKEEVHLYLVHLPEGGATVFLPRSLKLHSVPLFDLYDNHVKYGPILASLPWNLSCFDFACL